MFCINWRFIRFEGLRYDCGFWKIIDTLWLISLRRSRAERRSKSILLKRIRLVVIR